MTDITDQDRRAARQWAEDIYEMSKYDDETPRETCAAVKCILATVDAPTTLSEELANITEHWEEWATDMITVALAAATDRAKQTEYDLAEARAEVEQAEDRAAEWQGIAQRDYAKVERLTAVNENLRRTDNYRQFREKFLTVQKQLADVQKGAESNAESLDPADVPAGEAWLVEFYGEKRNAVKDGDDSTPWNSANTGGRLSCVRNEDVTLIARLVPAPRVITSPDELDPELIAVAPDLAHTIAGMTEEWGVEQATGTTRWFRSRPMAEAHAEVRGAYRLVRRLVGPAEAVE